MLFDPPSHEPLTERPWDEGRVRDAIQSIVTATEAAFDEDSLWPPHPVDLVDGPLSMVKSLYLGAAGVIWAFHELEQSGVAELEHDWAPIAASLYERYLESHDFSEDVDEPVPSLLMGEAGILLVAHTLAPASWQEERLLEAVRANVANPSRELMWGAPGTMVAARVMVERTGADEWRDAWESSAVQLLADWHDRVWEQHLPGVERAAHYIGPAHGFAGVVLALAQGDLLDDGRRAELERRAIATLATLAEHEDGLWQWEPTLEPPRSARSRRTQWCHGAPGIVASFGSLARGNDELSEMLLGGGELTWVAGPLVKGAQLCHGTAGNGYAFLNLLERTGDELWLERARAFAMHAIEQVERARATHGMGRHSLYTGDPGTAVYLLDCLRGTSGFPTVDRF